MSSLTGDGAPKDLRAKADLEDEDQGAYLRPDEHELQDLLDGRSTQVDRLDALRAGVAERRAAHLDGVPDEHHPDL